MTPNKAEFDETKQLLNYKKELLLEEYKALISFLQAGSNASITMKNWCITVWLLGIGLVFESKISSTLAAFAIAVMILAFWFINVFYSYYNVIHRRQYNQVCARLNLLYQTDIETVRSWKTPTDPFLGLKNTEKLKTVFKAAFSPSTSVVYLVLLIITFTVFSFFPHIP